MFEPLTETLRNGLTVMLRWHCKCKYYFRIYKEKG